MALPLAGVEEVAATQEPLWGPPWGQWPPLQVGARGDGWAQLACIFLTTGRRVLRHSPNLPPACLAYFDLPQWPVCWHSYCTAAGAGGSGL